MSIIELLCILAALGVGGGVGWAICRVQAGTSAARHEAENRLLAAQLEELKSTEALLRLEVNDAGLNSARLQALLEESEKKLTEERQRVERERVERQQADIQRAERQKEEFEALSRRTLSVMKDELEEKANREAQQKQQALDERLSTLLKPLRELIEQNDQKVKEVEKQHTEDTASLKTHLELLVAETGKLVSVKNSLADALSNSKGRGDWGEMELVRLLEASGLLPGVHYEAQKTQEGKNGAENATRPDITIRLSNQRVLYVDAKTILVNLERLLAADGSEEESAERKKHAAALEKEVLSLSLKAYEAKCRESIDFVVLYVPRESMLRAALEEKPALMELAFQRRVILASPLILMSILKTVAYGWDQAQLSQRANEIHALGRELHKRAALFLERFLSVGERIDAAARDFDKAKTAFQGRQGLYPHLRKFEEAGCKSEKLLPVLSASEEGSEEADSELIAKAQLLETAALH